MREKRQAGFTLVEILPVLGIAMILGAISIMNVVPAIRKARMDRAYQTVLMDLRRARQAAIDSRRVHQVSLIAPRTVQVQRLETDGTLTAVSSMDLPAEFSFAALSGIPVGSSATPDGFGTGSVAIDFNSSNQVFFQPNGSAQDATGAICNGVVYIARPEEPQSSRAISLFGATGRLKGWSLTERDGSLAWQ